MKGERQNCVVEHNRRRKVNVWEQLVLNVRTLYIFEKKFNTEVYLDILSDMQPEMRQSIIAN